MKNYKFICCGILAQELLVVFRELTVKVDVTFLPPALHVDYDKLEHKLVPILEKHASKDIVLIYGSQCHPEMADWQKKYGFKQPEEPDCIGILLGQERRKQFSKECNTFYLTSGWLKHWKKIFISGLGWDVVDARTNFSSYERILCVHSGISTLREEEILEFFDYTGVPVETCFIGLTHLKSVVRQLTGVPGNEEGEQTNFKDDIRCATRSVPGKEESEQT